MTAPSRTAWGRFVGHANDRARFHGSDERLSLTDRPPVGPCAYCGGPADSWDHVVPQVKGGGNAVSNLVPCCVPCNRRKHDGTPDEARLPAVITVLCGWCWTPIERTSADVLRAERKGRRSFACSKAHSGLISAGLLGPDWSRYLVPHLNRHRRHKAEALLASGKVS